MVAYFADFGVSWEVLIKTLANKKVAVHVATIQAILKTGVWSVGIVLDNLPKDLAINATVVGGGGTTVAAHLARAPFNMIKMILEGTDL